jgi:hypothetical protein
VAGEYTIVGGLADALRNMRGSILEAGAATDDQIDALEADVEKAARDPDTVFYQARIHQVSGRRPEPAPGEA